MWHAKHKINAINAFICIINIFNVPIMHIAKDTCEENPSVNLLPRTFTRSVDTFANAKTEILVTLGELCHVIPSFSRFSLNIGFFVERNEIFFAREKHQIAVLSAALPQVYAATHWKWLFALIVPRTIFRNSILSFARFNQCRHFESVHVRRISDTQQINMQINGAIRTIG